MLSTQQYLKENRQGYWVFCPKSSTNINNYIFKDKGLTIAGRGLLCTILALPKTSNISFSTLYTEITSRYTREELKKDDGKKRQLKKDLAILVQCFEELISMEYLHPDLIDYLDEIKGLQEEKRFVPLVNFLTGKINS